MGMNQVATACGTVEVVTRTLLVINNQLHISQLFTFLETNNVGLYAVEIPRPPR